MSSFCAGLGLVLSKFGRALVTESSGGIMMKVSVCYCGFNRTHVHCLFFLSFFGMILCQSVTKVFYFWVIDFTCIN